MLELYHGGATTTSEKVRLCLAEKALDYVDRRIALNRFQHHAPEYLAINPNGVVPALIDDGAVIVESMLINEYLDEKYPSPPLRPADPLGRARMRIWTRLADQMGPVAVIPLIWVNFKKITDEVPPEILADRLARIPLAERRDRWRKASQGGFTEADFAEARQAGDFIITRLERALAGAGPFIMGEHCTLADLDLFPFVQRFDRFYPDMLNETLTPHATGWLATMRRRPAVMQVYQPQ